MRKLISVALAVLFVLSVPAEARLDSKKVMYVGGTVTSIKEQTEGLPSTNDEKVFVFTYKEGKLTVPYDRINDLEYGQKAGRRLGLALTISPWLLDPSRQSSSTRHFRCDLHRRRPMPCLQELQVLQALREGRREVRCL